MTDSLVDLSSFFGNVELNADTLESFADLAYGSARARERFDELTTEARRKTDAGAGDPLRVALALLLLENYSAALEWFGKAPDNKTRRYYAAQTLAALSRNDEAIKEYQRAISKGWDEFEGEMQIAALHVRQGDAAAAEALVKKHAKAGQDRGDWYFVRGLLAELAEDREAAIELFEKTLTLSPDHAAAMFRCARLYDIRGHEEQAIELYRRLSLQPRAYVNALINLAVIYEDLGRYEDALECLRRVLRTHPNHTRARLFLKDVESSRQMVIEEVGEQRVDQRAKLLETPVTEFELSMRARNCLKKMRITTLGDLLKLSEEDLMAFKNFGETSLNEIKALLQAKGMRLGQKPDEIDVTAVVEAVAAPKVQVPPGSEAILQKSVAELELSVRARRCLQRLNIQTLGELIQRSESELLATRNFGVTSLNEIKTRLAEHGLTLAPKR